MNSLNIALINNFWSLITQRPHHWVREAQARGHAVTVFSSFRALRDVLRGVPEPDFVKRPAFAPLAVLRNAWGQFRGNDPLKRHYQRPFTRFLQRQVFSDIAPFDVVIYCSCPMPLLLDQRPKRQLLVYDCVDAWASFANMPSDVIAWEHAIAREADLIVAVSPPLVQRLAGEHGGGKVVLVPNGCDYDRFAQARPPAKPPHAPPVIGYTGTVASWFDWTSVVRLAEHYKRGRVMIVGPVENRPNDLPVNVEIVGRQPYEKMPGYVALFDVCIIPFRDVEGKSLIAAVSPIKLYEYLASGKPVVSTPMPDTVALAENGVVHNARNPDEFVREVGRALELAGQPDLVERRRARAREFSWARRWAIIEDRLHALREEVSATRR